MFGGMLLLLVLGLPVGFGLGGLSLMVALIVWGPKSLAMSLYGVMTTYSWFSLACVPLFVFMSILLAKSGIVEDLYRSLQQWFAPMPGSLAVITVVISTILAAMVGGVEAATLTMGYIALPIMLKFKYDKSIAIGCIQGGAALGFLIPPSYIAILYALIAKESIGRLFAGGLFPGLLISTMFIIYISVRCRLQPHLGPPLPKEERVPLVAKVKSLPALLPPILLIVGVLGSIFLGLATPVEASAVGAFGALLIIAARRRLTWKVLTDTWVIAVRISGMITWIVIGAITFGQLYDGLGARAIVETLVLGLPIGPMGIIGLMMVSWIIMGAFLDDTAVLLICAPVYLPIINALGFDPVWFGVLYLINMQMAYLTPPFGYCLFMMKAVVPPEISMTDIYRSVTPFVIIQCLGMILCLVFPEIVLWFPRVAFGAR